jgi:hypothetical protein
MICASVIGVPGGGGGASGRAPTFDAAASTGHIAPPVAQFDGMVSTGRAPGALTGSGLAGGVALTAEQRQFFEPRIGHDLGGIRLHADAKAEALSTLVGARAFTLGRDVFFAKGQFAPGTPEGKHLVAHELAHAVQQGAAPARQARGGRSLGVSARTPVRASAVPRLARRAGVIQRAAPVLGGLTLGAVAAKCIIGAIIGALADVAIQAAIAKFKGKPVKIDICSVILSAILGCIAAPISAAFLEPFIAAKLGPVLGGVAGTLIGKILIFIAKKLGMGVPKSLVGKLLKLGCISEPQAIVLGVEPERI